MLVGIDSMVLIFAGVVQRKGKKSNELEELRVRAQLLLHQKRDETVVLPTIAVAELLVPVPEAKRGQLIATVSGRFMCPSFDLPAAAIAADLWAHHANLPKDLQYNQRHVLKADVMIVAAAKSAGATEFYSHDRKCRALAKRVMKSFDLPTRDPNDMFLADDIRRGDVRI